MTGKMPVMTILGAGLGRRFLPVCLAVAALAGAPPASGQGRELEVRLEAPDSVRELLQRHVRVLRGDTALPEALPDRVALARRTRREVAELLATEGYFSPQVALERVADGPWRLIVQPGVPARIASVDLQFAGEIARDDAALSARRDALRQAWGLRRGQVFRQSEWDEAKRRLLDAVAERDFAAAQIADSRAEVDPEAQSVRLSVTVDSGPAFVLGALEVTGLERLPPDLVERYNTLEAGEPFDQGRLLALQNQLQNVPQFASVVVDVARDPALAGGVPVRVQVAEARSRHLGFGLGYSTNNGARGEVSWRDLNLLDRAWELSSGLRLEQSRQALYADVFLPPAPAGHRNSVGAAAERSDVEGLVVTTRAVGVARTHVRAGVGAEISTRLALRLQQETDEPDGAEASERTALTLNWSWTRRRVDDVLDPRQGDVMQFEVGGGARAALSDEDFLRLFARYARYLPMRQRDVLILRAEAGATVADSRDGVPQDFLFRTGGAQSVRGYGYQSLGVREGEATVGGRYLAAFSAEYVNWFSPQWGVAAFTDWGDAADDRAAFALKAGYGVGARWRSPAGPLALDLAYGVDDRRVRLHFGIAVAF